MYYYFLVSVKHNYHYISYLNNRVSIPWLHVSVLYEHHQFSKSCNIHFCLQLVFVLTNGISFVSQFLSTANESVYYSSYRPDEDGFGGLVVSMLSSGTQVRGLKPGRSLWIFTKVKRILSMPSFGGEVKESVPCPSFAAWERT
jgi:hypothetical protein